MNPEPLRHESNIDPGHVVFFPDSVCVLLLLDGDKTVLVQQHRPIADKVTLEAPGGRVEAGETAIAGARRELQEETGFDAEDLNLLFSLDLDFSASRHRTHVFTGVPVVGETSERTAGVEPIVVDIADALEMVQSGQITHAPTVAAVLAVAHADRHRALHG